MRGGGRGHPHLHRPPALSVVTVAGLLILAVRAAVFSLFVVAAVVALTHWAVARRHLTPFHPLARFGRRLGEPFVKRLERRMLRSGGNPSTAPYTFFWVALLGGLVAIALVEWLVGFVLGVAGSVAAGPRGALYALVSTAFGVLQLAIFIRVFASWFGLSLYSRPMRIVVALTEWLLEPLRRLIPPLGMFDVSPLVALLLLWLARDFVLSFI